ncbi:nuclear transport factor 2 family protein, partial [Rhodococcus ruber]|nr:nuclear transport factor 2 family protein [Rhodococcus ruber]
FLGVYRAFAEAGAEFSRHAIPNVRVTGEGDGRVRVDASFEATVAGPEGTQRLYGRSAEPVAARDAALRR